MKINSPCYECERRSVSCWDKCEEYKAYKQKLKEIKDKEREERKADKYGWHIG